ncbi:MAG TPA: glycosyl hydrolase 115 family protein [Vicinamibacterales bacterium]|jgi:hypothetical protein
MRATFKAVGLITGVTIACAGPAFALGRPAYVTTTPVPDAFTLAEKGSATPIWVDAADWPGVVRAAGDLQADVGRVTGTTPAIVHDAAAAGGGVVIVGTLGRSPLIDRLAREGRIDVSDVRGRWESFVLQTVRNPLAGVPAALVIAGSDKRGTIFGVYDLSEQMGVSPWYWWDDVAPEHKAALYVKPGSYRQGEPSVKYRGIFLNDEKPNLDFWVRAKFGEHPTPGGGPGTIANLNRQFYARLFELLLRLKANYLWPAMWNNAFAEDDPDNARLADEYGIVMGSSHQEPMMRAQKEWDWHQRAQYGNWNYATQADVLNDFWRTGVRARKDFENVYTIGLRGENDTPMVRTLEEGVALTEKIVAEQRRILAEVVNPDVTRIPQLWALYKEVQEYYERGLRVPDDVTLLWAEDNWGNIRRLPTPAERLRPGGAGVYYHFDYHGGPRSYQWIDTNPIPKIAEQMRLAKQYGSDRIWIVNVGHFKAYAFPTEYFLSLAWDTSRWTEENTGEFTRLWAAREFGADQAGEIADIMTAWTRFNGRRKPELLDAATYSVVNYREADRVVADYDAVLRRAEAVAARLPESKRDAFYELVLFPVKASANLNAMYVAAAKNALYASQGRASAGGWAEKTRALFKADTDLMTQFNKDFAGGKWDHFMDQPHIGYTTWRDPPANTIDAIKLVTPDVPAEARLGVAIEGSTVAWPAGDAPPARLPRFDSLNRQVSFIDVFKRGRTPFAFTAKASAPWITVSRTSGQLGDDLRIDVSIDWARAPAGDAEGTITLRGADAEVVVAVSARQPAGITRESLEGAAEGAGYVSIEAAHYTHKIDAGDRRWSLAENYGRTLSAMRAAAPVPPARAPATDRTPELGLETPRLEYRMYLFTPGSVTAALTLGPGLNFAPDRSVRLAVSFDDEPPQVVTAVPQGYNAQNGNRDWEETVRNNARLVSTTHTIAAAGYHTLKVWMIDPAVVLEKIVVNTSDAPLRQSYLGPEESTRGKSRP